MQKLLILNIKAVSYTHLSDELNKYGDNVVLVYGTGSIKKNGIYDDIIKILKESNKLTILLVCCNIKLSKLGV